MYRQKFRCICLDCLEMDFVFHFWEPLTLSMVRSVSIQELRSAFSCEDSQLDFCQGEFSSKEVLNAQACK